MATRRARWMDDPFECHGGSTATFARMLPWRILRAQCGRHVRVAKVIVNNNPQTMKRSRRSFRTAAGWLPVVIPADPRGHAMASDAFVACRGTRWLVRSLYFPVFLQIRNLPSRSYDLKHTHTSILPAAHSCARVLQLCFTHPKSRGGRSAEKRSGACEAPVGRALGASQDARVNALMTRHARRLRVYSTALNSRGFSPNRGEKRPCRVKRLDQNSQLKF
jgi:hypothetical protein